MAAEFDQVSPPVPVKPGYLQLTMDVSETGAPLVRTYEGRFFFRIMDATGKVLEERGGDPQPHMTGPMKQKLKDVLDWALDKAKATVP